MTDSRQQSSTSQEEPITLRCSRCGTPITPAEAILTPTGYRCKACVSRQQKTFDTSRPLDYVWGFLIAVVLSLIGSFIPRLIGFFTVLLAPAIGVGIAEAVRFVIKKRRSKRLFRTVTIGMIIGGLPLIMSLGYSFVFNLLSGNFSLFGVLPLVYQVLYLVMAVPSAYYRLSGSRRL